jgi:hypothetical protein
VSPRRFDRRTYMIVAPGWSALAFKAAMSASSASTTIRSAFPFTLSPTVNCHDIFGLPRSYDKNECSLASNDTLRANSISLCLGVLRRTARAPTHKKIKSRGGRRFKGHHMLHGPPHARFIYRHQSTMARVLDKWPFSPPSTSDLDQGQGQIF